MRTVTNQWRRNVLMFNPRWFVGNSVEAATRSLIADAGPRSYYTGRRIFGAADQETADLLRGYTLGWGTTR